MGVHFGGVHNVELPGLDVQKCNVSLTVKRLFRPYKEKNSNCFLLCVAESFLSYLKLVPDLKLNDDRYLSISVNFHAC
jgi:hypothetical protein